MFLDNIINNNNKISNRNNYNYKGNFIQNIENIHHNFFYCDQYGCNYKCKVKGSIKIHKANIHDIGVTWFYCDQDNCSYKCKTKAHLKKHKENIHDIARNQAIIDIASQIKVEINQKYTRKLNEENYNFTENTFIELNF